MNRINFLRKSKLNELIDREHLSCNTLLSQLFLFNCHEKSLVLVFDYFGGFFTLKKLLNLYEVHTSRFVLKFKVLFWCTVTLQLMFPCFGLVLPV